MTVPKPGLPELIAVTPAEGLLPPVCVEPPVDLAAMLWRLTCRVLRRIKVHHAEVGAHG